MPTTTPFGLRYHSRTDTPHGPDQIQFLAEDADNALEAIHGRLDALEAVSVNRFARRTSTKAIANSTTLVDDGVLEVAVDANTVYEFTCMLRHDGATTGDLKYQFTGPAGATLTAVVNQIQIAGGITLDDQVTGFQTLGSPLSAGAVGTGSTVQLLIHGLLVISSTAGTLKLQWAQDTSSAAATRVFTDSFIAARKVA